MGTVNKVDSLDGNAGEHKMFRTMYATAAVTAGNFVAINTADSENGLGYSVRHSTVTGQEHGSICGVAAQTLTAAGYVSVQVRGKYENANVAASVVAGDRLVASSSAGRAVEATTLAAASASFDYTVVAIALEAASSNQADVMLMDPFCLSEN